MVRSVLQAVYKEVRGLHQAAYVLALFTFGSQILALVRDRLLAHQFGAGVELDLFYAAFRIPDLLYVLFASTLSVYVLIPFVADRVGAKSSEQGQRLLSQVFTLFVSVYILLALAIGIAAPFLVDLIFPGFVEHKTELVLLIRILLIQPFFLGISSLFGVITQLGHRFVLYAVSPLLYNAGIILGVLFFYPYFGLSGLVWGVVLGAVGHLFVQWPFVRDSELAPKIVRSISWVEIRAILKVSVPRALTLSLHQIVLLGLVGFASVMSEGSVSVFQFAFNLQSVPLAIIGVSYSVAAFPLLAQMHAEGKTKQFKQHILTSLRHIIFWSVPILALIIVIRAQFVRVVLGSGEFDWNDTRLTAAVLALFAISLTAQAVHLLVVRALYAVGNTRLTFYVTLASSVGIMLLALLFHTLYVQQAAFGEGLRTVMRVEDVPGTEVLVLALAYTVGLFLHSIVLVVFSQKQLSFRLSELGRNVYQAIFAGAAAAVTAYATLNFFVEGLRTETLIGIALQGMLAGGLGLIASVLVYYVLGSNELHETKRAFHRRIFKTDVVAPQDEDHLAV